MEIIEKIKSKVTHIDIDELKERLYLELKISKENEQAEKMIEYSMYDTLLLILDIGNLQKINEFLYTTWLGMIKDYWYLNKYNEILKDGEAEDESDNDLEVSSIKEGDTQVNFSSKSSTININGTKYNVGTIEFDKNLLREKYKKDIYRHRKIRWG